MTDRPAGRGGGGEIPVPQPVRDAERARDGDFSGLWRVHEVEERGFHVVFRFDDRVSGQKHAAKGIRRRDDRLRKPRRRRLGIGESRDGSQPMRLDGYAARRVHALERGSACAAIRQVTEACPHPLRSLV